MYKQRGFTLIELTIVLAILAIIAAILIPTFLNTTDRARLRGDIQSARVIQNAMELYRVERGQAVAGTTMAVRIQNLANAGYIDARNIRTQTQGAEWVYRANHGVVVDINASPDGTHRAYANLSQDEQQFVYRGQRN